MPSSFLGLLPHLGAVLESKSPGHIIIVVRVYIVLHNTYSIVCIPDQISTWLMTFSRQMPAYTSWVLMTFRRISVHLSRVDEKILTWSGIPRASREKRKSFYEFFVCQALESTPVPWIVFFEISKEFFFLSILSKLSTRSELPHLLLTTLSECQKGGANASLLPEIWERN